MIYSDALIREPCTGNIQRYFSVWTDGIISELREV